MAKQFVKGNIYVFTKKKYIKDMGKDSINISWVNKCNGRLVTPNLQRQDGSIFLYNVFPEWCKCIRRGK